MPNTSSTVLQSMTGLVKASMTTLKLCALD